MVRGLWEVREWGRGLPGKESNGVGVPWGTPARPCPVSRRRDGHTETGPGSKEEEQEEAGMAGTAQVPRAPRRRSQARTILRNEL